MAIVISGNSCCPLCGELLVSTVGYFATSAFLDSPHPLWRFSDAAMHWPCYLGWDQQSEFARCYLAARHSLEAHNPFWHQVYSSEDAFVTVGEIGRIDVLLARLAFHVRVDRANWDRWLMHPSAPETPVQSELDRVGPALQSLTGIEIENQLASQSEQIAAKKQAAQASGLPEERRYEQYPI